MTLFLVGFPVIVSKSEKVWSGTGNEDAWRTSPLRWRFRPTARAPSGQAPLRGAGRPSGAPVPLSAFRGFAPLRGASPPANQGSPLRGFLSASLRSAEFGRAADAAQARASPASLTDGEDAVGTSRASARRTSSPVVGIFRRLASLGGFALVLCCFVCFSP